MTSYQISAILLSNKSFGQEVEAMRSRGLATWFAMDSLVHVSPKVLRLSELLGLDVDTTVGKLARLWAWAKLAQNETGELGPLPDEELAGIMRWKKKPAALTEALLASGILERTTGGALCIHGWYELNGKSAEIARKERERIRKIPLDTYTKTETETNTLKEPRGESPPKRDSSWMKDYD